MADEQAGGVSGKTEAKKPAALAALPVSIARSALFNVAPNGPSSKQRVIPTAKKGVNALITYTGPHLNMEHFRAWQALLFLAHERGELGGDAFSVPVAEVFKYMGKTYKDSEIKKKLYDLLTDLLGAVVTITSDRISYTGHKLIDVANMNLESRTVTVQFGERIAKELLGCEILRNDVERSRELKRHHLAIWLHGFVSSQSSQSNKKETMHTFSVDEIRMLCGSQAKERRHFCEDLGRALERLKIVANPLVSTWDWDDKRKKNKVIVTKVHTLVKLLEETKAVAADKRQGAAVQAARKARTTVCM